MSLPPRLTIRCAVEDLSLDHWSKAGPMADFPSVSDHKLVGKADALFKDSRDQSKAPTTISCVSPTCFKVKIDRFRAAAYRDTDGQVWIVSAGVRNGKSEKDFYQQFMALGSEKWLPSDRDKRLLERQLRRNELVNWENVIWNDLIRSLSASNIRNGFTLSIEYPFVERGDIRDFACSISIEAVCFDDCPEPLGIEVTLKPGHNVAYEPLTRLALRVIQSFLHSEEQQWSVTPGADGVTTIASLEFDDHFGLPEVLSREFSAQQPLAFEPGRFAHLVRHETTTDICQATVDGTPVVSLCGTTFVPRQDHETVELCLECEKIKNMFDKII